MKYATIVVDPPWDHSDGTGINVRNVRRVTHLPYPVMTLEEIAALPVLALAERHAHLYLWTTTRYLEAALGIASRWGFDLSAVLVWCKPSRGWTVGGTYASNVEFVVYAMRRMPRLPERRRYIAQQLKVALERTGKERAVIDERFGTKNISGHWFTPDGYSINVPTIEQWKWLREWLGVTPGSELDSLVLSENESKGQRVAPPLEQVPSRWFEWPRGRHSEKPEAFLDLVESVSPGPYLELFARRNRLGWDTWGNEALEHVGLETG